MRSVSTKIVMHRLLLYIWRATEEGDRTHGLDAGRGEQLGEDVHARRADRLSNEVCSCGTAGGFGEEDKRLIDGGWVRCELVCAVLSGEMCSD